MHDSMCPRTHNPYADCECQPIRQQEDNARMIEAMCRLTEGMQDPSPDQSVKINMLEKMLNEKWRQLAHCYTTLHRLGEYGFECEAGPLTRCREYADAMNHTGVTVVPGWWDTRSSRFLLQTQDPNQEPYRPCCVVVFDPATTNPPRREE